MALAQRLNELATANSEGLLNDDEYRLLRKDVFERYSDIGSTVAIVGTTTIPLPDRDSPALRKVVFQPQPKASLSSGVAGFLRRATTRKGPKDNGSTNVLKRAFAPRKKPSADMESIRTTSSGTPNDSISVSSHEPPTSPTGTCQSRSSNSRHFKLESGDDIFEDGGLSTTKELRQFISDLETEGRRVMTAFDELETSVSSKQVDSSMLFPDTHLSMHKHHRHGSSDALSVRSYLSRNRSTRASPSPSALVRKGSLSSLSSQGTSLLSAVRPGLSSHTSLSRSAGHLPLSILREGAQSSDTVGDMDSDIAVIRQRRRDVARRYEDRLEYLRARLKGAELHEKLLRK